MGLRSGTQWCPDCGFEQLVPELHAPLAGRSPVLATGTPVATAGGGSSLRIGLSAALAVVAVVTIALIFGLLPGGDDDRRAAVGGDALIRPTEPAVTPVGGAVEASAEVDEDKKEARRRRKARRAAATPSASPSATPTVTATATPTALPTPAASPTPASSPTPRAPRTNKPKPRTPQPSPTPPANPQPPAPAPTPTPPPAPQPTPSPTPPPPPPPAPSPTPTPPTAEEIAAGLPAGMTCASLKRAGHSYAVAYAYWVRIGRPFWPWDANRNGTICELDY